jgi:hypothetical protein
VLHTQKVCNVERVWKAAAAASKVTWRALSVSFIGGYQYVY